MAAENEYAAVCRSFPVLDGEKVGIARLCSILHTSTQGETPKDGNCMFHAILDQIRYNSRLPDFAADQECPLPGHTDQYGRVESVIYRAKITREDTGATEHYTGLTGGTFMTRWYTWSHDQYQELQPRGRVLRETDEQIRRGPQLQNDSEHHHLEHCL